MHGKHSLRDSSFHRNYTHKRAVATAGMSKKLINNPEQVVEEALEGLVAAQPGLQLLAGHRVVLRADTQTLATEGKVRSSAKFTVYSLKEHTHGIRCPDLNFNRG